jgi:hypothetical protein
VRSLLAVSLALCVACSATKHVGPPLVDVPVKRQPPVTVIIEPFFEQARMVTTDRTQTATIQPPFNGGFYGTSPQTVMVTQRIEEKPLLARATVLSDLHARVMFEVKRRRPEWNVQSTGVLTQTRGDVTLVRTVVGDAEITGSNRTLRNMAFGFGIVIWPLLFLAAGPIEESQRVYGTLWRYDTAAEALQGKLIRYPTQPDFAVDTRGLKAREQAFGLDIMYEEALFTAEASKDPVLIEGFAQQLAGAIIAIAEGY